MGKEISDKNNVHMIDMGAIEGPDSQSKVFGGVVYECVRCGSRVTADELAQLPEIKCICGYRVLKKARPPVVKQVKSI